MTITLTLEQERELWAEARENSQQNLSEPYESYCQVPKQLGKGYIPLLSLSAKAIARSLMRQSIQAILLEKNWSCIYY